jgi:hypothetical protein
MRANLAVTHDRPVAIGIELVRAAGLAGTAPYAYGAVSTVAAWDVVREAFGEHEVPSTLVGVTVLGRPDQLVEVEAVAVLDSWREPAPPHDEPGDPA